jgi:hypothetical protein
MKDAMQLAANVDVNGDGWPAATDDVAVVCRNPAMMRSDAPMSACETTMMRRWTAGVDADGDFGTSTTGMGGRMTAPHMCPFRGMVPPTAAVMVIVCKCRRARRNQQCSGAYQ